jgi:hypothetical protein
MIGMNPMQNSAPHNECQNRMPGFTGKAGIEEMQRRDRVSSGYHQIIIANNENLCIFVNRYDTFLIVS